MREPEVQSWKFTKAHANDPACEWLTVCESCGSPLVEVPMWADPNVAVVFDTTPIPTAFPEAEGWCHRCNCERDMTTRRVFKNTAARWRRAVLRSMRKDTNDGGAA